MQMMHDMLMQKDFFFFRRTYQS